jgi:hypothetical protein
MKSVELFTAKRVILPTYFTVKRLQPPAHAASSLAYFSTLTMEAISSFETSVHKRSTTRRHIPEDGILHSHRRENLKSYNVFLFTPEIFSVCVNTSLKLNGKTGLVTSTCLFRCLQMRTVGSSLCISCVFFFRLVPC